MSWLKIIAEGLGLASLWSRFFAEKKQQETGAKLQQGETDAATLKVISKVNAPVSVSESDQLWDKNSARYGKSPRTPWEG